jgi:hypothetical protein
MPYDIDETIATGDPEHPEHHTGLAVAVNDLDSRVSGVEAGVTTLGTSKLNDTYVLTALPETEDPNLFEVIITGQTRAWLNEWGAFRGRNPYTSWADALVRAIVNTGDITTGNAFEIEDRRTGHPSNVLFGVNWGTGRVVQGDNQVGLVYILESTEDESDIPATLPAGTLIVRKTVV